MILRHSLRFLFGKKSNIRSLQYEQENMQMLSIVLSLSPKKQELAKLMNEKLLQICPNLQESKKQFTRIGSEIQGLYQFIKQKILKQNDNQLDQQFFQRAHYYFLKQGKRIRPLMIIMLSQNFKTLIKKQNKNFNFQKIDSEIKKWGALMEIMHIASLAHDDIVDDSPSRRGQQSQHLKYGSKMAVFSGNYIISKASKAVSEFNCPRLYQIYANTMSSLAEGQIKQLIAKSKNYFINGENQQKNQMFLSMMQRYMQKTYSKSAALMCGSLLGVPTIFYNNLGSQFQKIVQKQFTKIQQISVKIGQHYGLALQLIDDILDYISTAQQMGKQEMSDLVQGNVTAPVYLTYKFRQNIKETGAGLTLQLLNKKKKTKQDALIVKKWVEEGVGIQLTYLMGALHVLQGIQQLKKLKFQQNNILFWRYLGNKLMTRRK